ncbi:MAG: GntR family transcriptional regulator [Planctomycetota bacterium]
MEPFEFSWKRVYWQLRQKAFQRQPGESLGMTFEEAAETFHVNVKTVSRAIRQLKAEGILLTKRKHGTFVHPHRPTIAADGKVILHVVRNYSSRATFAMLDSMSACIEKIAETKGYRVIPIDPHDLNAMTDLLKEGQIFGAVLNTLMGLQAMTGAIERLRAFGVKMCAIEDPLPDVDSVVFDNVDIGRQIGKILMSQTDEDRILALRQWEFTKSRFEREEGFQRVCHSSPKTASQALWLTMAPRPLPPFQAVEDYIRNGVRFDCAFVHSASIAKGLREVCKSLKVPEPYIAAFGNLKQLEESRTAGAYLDMDLIVRDAVNQIFDQARDPSRPPVTIRHSASIYIPV